jgi:hypothetical protein
MTSADKMLPVETRNMHPNRVVGEKNSNRYGKPRNANGKELSAHRKRRIFITAASEKQWKMQAARRGLAPRIDRSGRPGAVNPGAAGRRCTYSSARFGGDCCDEPCWIWPRCRQPPGAWGWARAAPPPSCTCRGRPWARCANA